MLDVKVKNYFSGNANKCLEQELDIKDEIKSRKKTLSNSLNSSKNLAAFKLELHQRIPLETGGKLNEIANLSEQLKPTDEITSFSTEGYPESENLENTETQEQINEMERLLT